jgi:3-hydroxyisobutyrate dehydrogenase-like beta-hydroxyacid dehydrogenase
MAERLLAAGHPLTVFARRPEVLSRFVGLGATAVDSLSALGRESDLVCVVVVDDQQVRDVVGNGEDDGLLAGMAPGSVIAIHSTVSPQVCREIGDLAAASGVVAIDAPVSGGSQRAHTGTLTVMVGAEPDAFARVSPVFAAFGSMVRRIGPLGSGQLAKLINNYMFAAHAGVAEQVVALMRGFELDADRLAEVLMTGSGSSTAFAMAAERKFTQPVHQKGFDYALRVLTKDVRLLEAEAAKHDVSLALTRDFIDKALAALAGPNS